MNPRITSAMALLNSFGAELLCTCKALSCSSEARMIPFLPAGSKGQGEASSASRWLGNSVRSSNWLSIVYREDVGNMNTPSSLRIYRSLHHWIRPVPVSASFAETWKGEIDAIIAMFSTTISAEFGNRLGYGMFHEPKVWQWYVLFAIGHA